MLVTRWRNPAVISFGGTLRNCWQFVSFVIGFKWWGNERDGMAAAEKCIQYSDTHYWALAITFFCQLSGIYLIVSPKIPQEHRRHSVDDLTFQWLFNDCLLFAECSAGPTDFLQLKYGTRRPNFDCLLMDTISIYICIRSFMLIKLIWSPGEVHVPALSQLRPITWDHRLARRFFVLRILLRQFQSGRTCFLHRR